MRTKQNSGTSSKSQRAVRRQPSLGLISGWHIQHGSSRVIELEVNGKLVGVPFAVGDENVEEDVQAVYCAEDVVVPPRQAYMLKGIVGTARQKVATSAHEVWLVESRSEQQQEQLDRSAEEAIARLESMHEQAKHTAQKRQRS